MATQTTYARDKKGRLVREESEIFVDTRTRRALAAGFRFAGRCLPWGRYRHIVAPYWASLGIATAATAAWTKGAWYAPLLIAPAVGAVFWWGPSLVARLVARRGGDVEAGSTKAGRWLDRKPERVYAAAVTATAGVMSQAVIVFGWSKWLGWSWLAATLAGGAPWQHHHRWWLRGPAQATGQIAAAWPRCQEKIHKLRDCTIGPDMGEGAVEKHLLTVPEGREATSVLDVGNAIAGIIGAPSGTVTVTLGDDDEDLTARQAWIVKAPKAQLRTSQIFDGPTLDEEGTFHLANAADGPIDVMAHDKDGVKHFGGFGTTGSGKGSIESNHIINRVETGWWLPVLVDGKGGASVHGALQDASYYVACTRTEWIAAIDAVHKTMVARREEFGRRRWTRYRIWEMWRKFPAIALVLDECPTLARQLPDHSKRKLLEIGEQGRSLGIAVGAFGQSSHNAMIPGGSLLLGLLTGGGCVWYGRAGDSRRDKTVEIHNKTYSLTDFPAGAGWGYITGGAMAGTRVIKARGLWIPDDKGDPVAGDHLDGWTPSKPLPAAPAELAVLHAKKPAATEGDADGATAVSPATSPATESGPTAKDAIVQILEDAAGEELTMGEITRRTADMAWRDGHPYDKSTIREALPKIDGVVQGLKGWKLAS